MSTDPTERFTHRVDDYIRYRPLYPPAVLDVLEGCGLTAEWVIADVGCGPGNLTRLLLDNGNPVYGVEPNQPMREAGARLLAGYARFTSVAGTAEATALADGSVRLVTAAQAFHWFDARRARQEFTRILRPPGWVALIWNERRPDSTPFLAGYDRLAREYAIADVGRRTTGQALALQEFFGPGGYSVTALENSQQFDLEGLRGRLLSSSYAPVAGQPGHAALLDALRALFERHQKQGRVTLEYDTRVYLGCL